MGVGIISLCGFLLMATQSENFMTTSFIQPMTEGQVVAGKKELLKILGNY